MIYNSQICGYDGYHVNKSIEEHYRDVSCPFGHELVLYSLLTTDKYPWTKYTTEKF